MQATGIATSFFDQCRVVGRNPRRDGGYTYSAKTKFMDCDAAQTWLETHGSFNRAFGQTERQSYASVTFETAEGQNVSSVARVSADLPKNIGREIKLLYVPNNPNDVIQYQNIPFITQSSGRE